MQEDYISRMLKRTMNYFMNVFLLYNEVFYYFT